MAIDTVDKWVAGTTQKGQRLVWYRTGTRTTIAAMPFSVYEVAGCPYASALAIGNTSNGVLHSDATTGYPPIASVGAGNTCYISRIEYGSSVACRLKVFDCLWAAGAFNANTNGTQNLTTPDWSGRLPTANNYEGLELWYECVTAVTANQSIKVDYLNQANTAANTGTVATAVAPTLGRMLRIPLAAGDTGLRAITSVTGTVSTAGTFNLRVMRPIWTGRVSVANQGEVHDFMRLGMPKVSDNTAFFVQVSCDSTALGLPELYIDLVEG